ncbi:hypothetical protein KKW20_08905 [Planktotalea lamellibrachiae]|nr:hypothetical protein [Aliiroseovarius lamellibrachiae]
MLGGIRDRKTRSWEKASVQDIVEKIAGEHGLKPVVGDSVKSAFFEYLAQTSESDLHFLTRLAKDLDAVAKPAGGALVFMARGEGKAADGSALPVTTVFQHEIDTGSWSLPQRGKYGRVIAEWGDKGAGSLNTVTAGDEKPELKLRHPYATKDEAQRAAKAALKKSQRTGGKLKIQMGGFYPDMMAEAFVNLPDIKPELRGEWLMTRVEHQLEDSLTTSFNAERGNDGAKT